MDAKLQRARRQERLSDQAPRVLLNPLPRISRVRREEAEDRKKTNKKSRRIRGERRRRNTGLHLRMAHHNYILVWLW